MNKTAYILVGHPYTGKSSFIKEQKIINDNVPVIISSDMFLEQYAAQYGLSYSDIFHEKIKWATKESDNMFDYAIEHGLDIVIDKTNMTKKSREKWIKPLLENDYEIVCVVFKHLTKDELDKRRSTRTDKFISDEVINMMISKYEQPNVHEGISHILFKN